MQGYVIPGYNRAREGLLKQERRHIENLLDSTKSTWAEKGVTICSDGWSDPQRRPIINFVAVSDKAPMFLRADNCEGQYKSKEYIAEKLKGIIEEVGRHNVVQIITDNAAKLQRYYSKRWLEEGVGREPPHKDKEVSKMRMVCFKKFFPMPEELAKVKEEYSRRDKMWDVGGDSFDSLGGIGVLEVADLSLDEPELQSVTFGLDAEAPQVDDNETNEE
ncbi:hypothetical protein PR202_gb16154 [Eleusine coracana subsp. coracana]|uniref:DUF659 domain-containing protein n=1 Tax=Eleusine coracana subsp. coracana TaxID=191504 RepID=A0AAV5F0C5_ELECO|nr:hypothetical protein PR202_gb16154 [Eleusine coracana subsp. coracana]